MYGRQNKQIDHCLCHKAPGCVRCGSLRTGSSPEPLGALDPSPLPRSTALHEVIGSEDKPVSVACRTSRGGSPSASQGSGSSPVTARHIVSRRDGVSKRSPQPNTVEASNRPPDGGGSWNAMASHWPPEMPPYGALAAAGGSISGGELLLAATGSCMHPHHMNRPSRKHVKCQIGLTRKSSVCAIALLVISRNVKNQRSAIQNFGGALHRPCCFGRLSSPPLCPAGPMAFDPVQSTLL